jgi:hypothetical protein
VMAALVESGLKNLTGGDNDAKGYFAMRVSIWNTGPYAGFSDNPELQLTWFIDQALQTRARRVAAGDAEFGLDPNTWGEWVADVQRPAAHLRGAYQLRLAEARLLVGPSCAGFPPPRASDDAYTAVQGSLLRVAAPGVLANDAGSGALSAALASAPAHGTVSIAPDGGFEYQSAGAVTGTDSFTYSANLGTVASAIATVNLTVVAPAPPAGDPTPPPSNAFTVGRRLAFKDGATMITVRVPGPGTITARQSRATTSGRQQLVKRTVKVARQAGPVKLAIRPTTAGRKELRRKAKLTVRLRITFKPTGGIANSTVEKVTIRRSKR